MNNHNWNYFLLKKLFLWKQFFKCGLVWHCVSSSHDAPHDLRVHFWNSSHVSAASSSSSLWDLTLIKPIPPAVCYCPICLISESFSTLTAVVSGGSHRFSVWCYSLLLELRLSDKDFVSVSLFSAASVWEQSAAQHLITLLCGEDVSHTTAQWCVSEWVDECESRCRVWVWKKQIKWKKYMSSTWSCALALVHSFVLRKKRKRHWRLINLCVRACACVCVCVCVRACVRACVYCASTCGFNLCSLLRLTPLLPSTKTCDHWRHLCDWKPVMSQWILHPVCPRLSHHRKF